MTPEQHRVRAERYLMFADNMHDDLDGSDDLDAEVVAHLTMLGTLAQAHAMLAQAPPNITVRPPSPPPLAAAKPGPHDVVPLTPYIGRDDVPGDLPGPSHIPTNERLDIDEDDGSYPGA